MISFAEAEPEIEDKMQSYLLKTKEKGNLSFSTNKDYYDDVVSLNESETQASPHDLTTTGQSHSAVLTTDQNHNNGTTS